MRLTSSVRERLVTDSNPTSDCQIRAQGERRFLAECGQRSDSPVPKQRFLLNNVTQDKNPSATFATIAAMTATSTTALAPTPQFGNAFHFHKHHQIPSI